MGGGSIKVFRSGLTALLLVSAIASSMILVVTPAYSGGGISHPHGTTINVVQGGSFLLHYRLYWNEPGYDGTFGITLFWNNHENRPTENLTYLSTRAYYDNQDNIPITVDLSSAPQGENTLWCLDIGNTGTGGPQPYDNAFNVDIWMSAAGARNAPHVPGNHLITGGGFKAVHVDESSIEDVEGTQNPITIHISGWTEGVVVRGRWTCYSVDVVPPPAFIKYENGDFPPIAAAKKWADNGSLFAWADSSVCRNSTTGSELWNDPRNPAPYLDVLFDKVMQWMVPGAENVLWFIGDSVYIGAAASCSELIDALTAKGYHVTRDNENFEIIDLSHYQIVIIPGCQYGDWGTGGDPTLLPDNWVAAMDTFVKSGRGLIVMEYADYGGMFIRVQNKILKGIEGGTFPWCFQSDTLSSGPPDNYTAPYLDNWQDFLVDVDNTTAIGAMYQTHTGTDNLGIYRPSSLTPWPTLGSTVTITPDENKAENCTIVTFNVKVKNNGSCWEKYTLELSDNTGWPELSWLPTVLTTKLSPTKDAYVNENAPTTNYGTATSDIVGGDKDPAGGTNPENDNREAFLTFDLSALGAISITSAKLYMSPYPAPKEIWVVAHKVDNDTWGETSVIWDDKPAIGDVITTKKAVRTWTVWDVTSFVQEQFAVDNRVSLGMRADDNTTADGRCASFTSREGSASYRPYLEVTYTTYFTTTTLEVAKGGENTKSFQVHIPCDAPVCTRDLLTVKATSYWDNTVSSSDTSTAHCFIGVYGVDVSISPGEKSGLPGQTLSYTVTVKNTGNVDDNYVLTVSDNENWGDNIWLEDNSLWVAKDDNENSTTLYVHIPDNAIGCTRDNITVTATSQGDNTVENSASCIAHATEIVREVDVSISPSSQSGTPGLTLSYTVTVKNEGNVSDTYDLGASDGWATQISPTSLIVAAGDSGTATLDVTIPSGTSGGATMTITVTATSRTDPGVSDSASCEAVATAVKPPAKPPVEQPSGAWPPPTPTEERIGPFVLMAIAVTIALLAAIFAILPRS